MAQELKSYPEYKPTEYDWLPDVPKHWEKRYLFQVNDEQSISNRNIHHQNLLSLSYGNIIKKDINSTKGLLPESFDTYQVVNDGNIILRLTDLQNDHKSLRVGLVTQTGIITSAYTCLKPKNVSSRFIHYLLHAYDLRKVFYGMGGGLRQSIGFKELRYLHLYIPPRTEQDQIVKYLDFKLSKINKFIKSKKREIELLKELKQVEINSAVTKGLNPNVPMKDSGIDWFGEIPEHWEIKYLRNLLKITSIKNRPEMPLLSVVREKGVILRDILSKEENHNFIPDDLSGYKFVRKGQFVINKMKAWQGSYAVSDYDGIVSPAYYVYNLNFPNKEFFHTAIRSKIYVNFFAQYSDGIRVGQWDLSSEKMKMIPFFVPPIDEQENIVKYVSSKLEIIEKYTVKVNQEINILKEYKTSLISDVVTGKVDVRDIIVEDSFDLETLEEVDIEIEEMIEE